MLRPAEQFFDEMLAGWTTQQTSRMLAAQTIKTRASQVRRFADFCSTPPWEWSPADVEEWTTSLVSGPRPLAVSTVRAYQNAVALFCDYLIDHRYGWVDRCVDLFGTHRPQVCHEWNTVIHTSDHEARPAVRPLSRAELQAFFDYADDLVDRARSSGRKGWQTLFRDATLFRQSTPSGCAAVRPRCSICTTSPQPAGLGVRPVRGLQRPLGQGDERVTASPPSCWRCSTGPAPSSRSTSPRSGPGSTSPMSRSCGRPSGRPASAWITSTTASLTGVTTLAWTRCCIRIVCGTRM